MMTKEMLKQIGIIGVSFGLVASPLAFAAHHEEQSPEAKATDSAADPMSEGDMADSQEGGMAMDHDDTSSSAEATGSAADPTDEDGMAGKDEGMIMDEDETSSSAEATGSAANPEEQE